MIPNADIAFPAVGQIGPAADGVDEPYWLGLREGQLRIQRCGACGRWIWAPQWRCGACGSFDLHWADAAPRGRIYSWVRTWHPFAPELAAHVPYVTALVELPDADGVRLLGILVADKNADVRIGQTVAAAIQPASDITSGWPVLRWRPIGAPEASACA